MPESVEKHHTSEQLGYLQERWREFSDGTIKAVEAEWPELMRRVRTEMEAGSVPAYERVQVLVRRRMELVEMSTGGNSGIHKSLNNTWQQEDNATVSTREMGRTSRGRRTPPTSDRRRADV